MSTPRSNEFERCRVPGHHDPQGCSCRRCEETAHGTDRARVRIERSPIVPERVRRIDGQSFCFIPHRFLREGFFAALSADELLLYLVLVLAADRNGVSFYHQDSLCSLLEMPMHRYLGARNALIDADLLAFDGRRFQLLSLPAKPRRRATMLLRTEQDFEQHDPATVRQIIGASWAETAGRPR